MLAICLFIIFVGAVIFMVTMVTTSNDKGCYKNSKFANLEMEQNNRFHKTEEYYYIDKTKFSIIVDTQTKNLYLYSLTYTYGGNYIPTLTPLYDENGKITNKNTGD